MYYSIVKYEYKCVRVVIGWIDVWSSIDEIGTKSYELLIDVGKWYRSKSNLDKRYVEYRYSEQRIKIIDNK